jgi:hypothetical protein
VHVRIGRGEECYCSCSILRKAQGELERHPSLMIEYVEYHIARPGLHARKHGLEATGGR